MSAPAKSVALSMVHHRVDPRVPIAARSATQGPLVA